MEQNQPDVLQNAPPAAPRKPETHRGKGLGFVLGIFLFAMLVAFGERLIYDLNRNVNPYTCSPTDSYPVYNYRYQNGQTDDTRAEVCGSYKMTRLLLILALVVPLVVGAFVLYIKFAFQHQGRYLTLAWSFIAFALWMFSHLFVETAYFLLQQYKTVGIYAVLVISIALLTVLTLVLQKYRQPS